MPDSRAKAKTFAAFLLTLTLYQACVFLSCTDELGMEVRPREASLALGETFTPILRLTTCGGRKRILTPVVWESSDTAVVRVEPSDGRTTARATGTADVFARSPRYGIFPPIRVTVR
jgi:hypothetical protein